MKVTRKGILSIEWKGIAGCYFSLSHSLLLEWNFDKKSDDKRGEENNKKN